MSEGNPFGFFEGPRAPRRELNVPQRLEVDRYKAERLVMLDTHEREREALGRSKLEAESRVAAKIDKQFEPQCVQLATSHASDKRFLASRANTSFGRAVFIAQNWQRFATVGISKPGNLRLLVFNPRAFTGALATVQRDERARLAWQKEALRGDQLDYISGTYGTRFDAIIAQQERTRDLAFGRHEAAMRDLQTAVPQFRSAAMEQPAREQVQVQQIRADMAVWREKNNARDQERDR